MYARETLAKLRECYASWVEPHFGPKELADISVLDVLGFRKAMAERSLSVARQYSLLMFMKLLLRFCRTVLKQPCLDPGEIKLPKRTHHQVEFLTNEEVNALLRVIPTHTFIGLRARVLIEVLLSTGMRISEALSLNRSSIDYKVGEAEIVGKGGKQRVVFFSPRCLAWIAAYLDQRRDGHPVLFITTGAHPRRLTRNDMSKLFIRLRRASGITKKLTPHLLRHTFCTSLLHNGADITFIKELAGHQDIETTARYYLGVDKEALRAVLRRCRPLGWNDVDLRLASPETSLTPPPVSPLGHRSETFDVPASPPGGPVQDSTGRSSPDAHGRESL